MQRHTYLWYVLGLTACAVLALLLALGSTIGAQIGARVSRYLRGEQLLIILASLALAVVGKMVIGEECYLPCTPHAIQQILVRSGIPVEGKHVVKQIYVPRNHLVNLVVK